MRTVIGMSWNGILQAILHSAREREIPPNVVDDILRRSRELKREAEIKEEEIRLLKKSLRRMAQKQEQASASSATSMALAVAVMGIVTSTVTTSSRMARMRRERLAAAAEFVTAIEIYDSVKRPAVDVPPFFIQASEQARLFREAMSKLEASDEGSDEALAASLLEILKIASDALEREKAQASPTEPTTEAEPAASETTKNPWSDILRLASDTMPTLLGMYIETQARARAKRRHQDDALKAADRLALVFDMLTENIEDDALDIVGRSCSDYYAACDCEKEAAAEADEEGGMAIAEAVAKAAESVDEQGSSGRVTAKKAKKRHIRHAAILDDGAVVGSGHETAGSTPEDAGS